MAAAYGLVDGTSRKSVTVAPVAVCGTEMPAKLRSVATPAARLTFPCATSLRSCGVNCGMTVVPVPAAPCNCPDRSVTIPAVVAGTGALGPEMTTVWDSTSFT